ncbi:hypothetical protein ACGFYQ_34000 [Streptomyces sp. NPDC048258]|uniref:hypothetical protein n=1 Tax=Streptomyces sp. NPDC048258 TaxID=3365527 RepID=UPI00370FAAC7
MTTIVFPLSRRPDKAARIALIACGDRPGKTSACESCSEKAEGLLRIACTEALEAVAAAVCSELHNGACAECTTKATRILAVAGEPA